MNITFRQADKHELPRALELLKMAAIWLRSNHIDQWQIWLNPSLEKIAWIEEGFEQNEFFFIENNGETVGMFRLMKDDQLYWGVQTDSARYIHSLIIARKFAGANIGRYVLDRIAANTMNDGIHILRLDCNAANQKLCEYYENLGFKKVGQKQMPDSLNNLYEKSLP